MKYLNPLSLSGYSCHRPAHCALTHFVRRGDVRDDVLKNVFYMIEIVLNAVNVRFVIWTQPRFVIIAESVLRLNLITLKLK